MIEKNKITEKIPTFPMLWFGEEKRDILGWKRNNFCNPISCKERWLPKIEQAVWRDGGGGSWNYFTPPFFTPRRKLQELPWGRSWTRGGIFEREGRRGKKTFWSSYKKKFGESKEKKVVRGGLIGRIGTAFYSYFSLLNFPGTREKEFLASGD